MLKNRLSFGLDRSFQSLQNHRDPIPLTFSAKSLRILSSQKLVSLCSINLEFSLKTVLRHKTDLLKRDALFLRKASTKLLSLEEIVVRFVWNFSENSSLVYPTNLARATTHFPETKVKVQERLRRSTRHNRSGFTFVPLKLRKHGLRDYVANLLANKKSLAQIVRTNFIVYERGSNPYLKSIVTEIVRQGESYGVDILERLLLLLKKSKGEKKSRKRPLVQNEFLKYCLIEA